jgi:protein-tyrosine phosphatase
MQEQDYQRFDHIFVMDTNNLRWLNMRMPSIVQYRNGRYADPSGKIRLLMTLAGREADVADPWYTGNFNRTYRDICEALTALLEMI